MFMSSVCSCGRHHVVGRRYEEEDCSSCCEQRMKSCRDRPCVFILGLEWICSRVVIIFLFIFPLILFRFIVSIVFWILIHPLAFFVHACSSMVLCLSSIFSRCYISIISKLLLEVVVELESKLLDIFCEDVRYSFCSFFCIHLVLFQTILGGVRQGVYSAQTMVL